LFIYQSTKSHYNEAKFRFSNQSSVLPQPIKTLCQTFYKSLLAPLITKYEFLDKHQEFSIIAFADIATINLIYMLSGGNLFNGLRY